MIARGQAILAPFERLTATGGILVDLGDRPVVDADLGDAGVVEAEADPADARAVEFERGRVAGPVVVAERIRVPPAVPENRASRCE